MVDTNPYTSTRICEDCGKVMVNVYHAKRFCPECAEKRHRARTAAWWAKKKDEISSPYPKEETAAQRIKNAEERGRRLSGRLPGSGCRRAELRQVYAAEKQTGLPVRQHGQAQRVMEFARPITPMISHFRRFYK